MEKYESVVHLFVMYTISDENTRTAFYNALVDEFNIIPQDDKLNESAYVIRGVNRAGAINRLLSIVKPIQETGALCKDDFIDLYYSGIEANYTCKFNKDAHDNIIRLGIYPRN